MTKTVKATKGHSALSAIAAAAILLAGTCVAQSGPCTTQIEQFEHQVRGDTPGPSPAPTAPQSLGAQLHHQPTPGSVGQAAHVANKDGDDAIERAKTADAAGDATSCHQALAQARQFYDTHE